MLYRKVVNSREKLGKGKAGKHLDPANSVRLHYSENSIIGILGPEFPDFLQKGFHIVWQKEIMLVLRRSENERQIRERATLVRKMHGAPCGPQHIVAAMERVD